MVCTKSAPIPAGWMVSGGVVDGTICCLISSGRRSIDFVFRKRRQLLVRGFLVS